MNQTLTFLLVSFSTLMLHAATPTSEENAAAMQWAQRSVFAEQAKLPFKFTLDGKTSDELLLDWKRTDSTRELDAKRREHTRSWMDATTGLQLRLVATEYVGFPVVEWTVWIKNTGDHDTPLIENIQGLNSTFAANPKDAISLHGIRGDTCVAESFQPWTRELKAGASHRFSPPVKGGYASGKSSETTKGDAALFGCDEIEYNFGMPRRPRVCPANTCFHVLNRAVARLPLFEKMEDYEAFERVLRETWERHSLPIYSYCVMPNHWHFVVCPSTKNQLTEFFRWLTHTHTMRWHAHHQTQGTGHLYQGRFKTFPIESDEHLLAVLRYVERNPVRANLCKKAEDWKFSSAWLMQHGDAKQKKMLSKWPIPRPRSWHAYVNEPQSEGELETIRHSVIRGTPFGSESWVTQSAARLQLKHTLRPRGRPKKQ